MTVGDTRARVVLASGMLVGYPEGGGHWTGFLQYLLGLTALGHDVLWLEFFYPTDDPARNAQLLATFFERMERYGVAESCVVVEWGGDHRQLSDGVIHGVRSDGVEDWCASADVVWNFASALPRSLYGSFRRRAFVDGDPGHLQVSAIDWDLGLDDHEVLFTVGSLVGRDDCLVPLLGREWRTFLPVVHLPFWAERSQPLEDAPFTSLTHWNWGELWFGDRVLSISKRDAYLRYLDLPGRTSRRFVLGAALGGEEDASLLEAHGWELADPYAVASSPEAYLHFVDRSFGELCCCKPVYRQLRTGWLSERSAGYLASGRPVLAEETGFSDVLPAGVGLLAFASLEEAATGVAEIASNWSKHSEAARGIAHELLDGRKTLSRMVEESL